MPDEKNPVAGELEEVEKLLSAPFSRLAAPRQLTEHLVGSGGKRVRPQVALLAAGCCSGAGREALHLAAAVEFLHTASLLHDDVLDGAERRRGRVSANATWGNSLSVLVGDLLYTRAFALLEQSGSPELLALVIAASARLVEGEIKQLGHVRDTATREGDYFEVIENKTARLFSVSAEGGAVLAGAPAEQRAALAGFGREFGLCFQLTDDWLDYGGEAAQLGKNTGGDFAEGKMTLPLIYALAECDEGGDIAAALADGGKKAARGAVRRVARPAVRDYVAAHVAAHRARAGDALGALPDTPHRRALARLLDGVCERAG